MERSPLGFGDPEDLTGAVVLLCSPAGKFMTGTDIVIDGEFDLLQQPRNRLREARWLHNLLINDLYVFVSLSNSLYSMRMHLQDNQLTS